MDFVPMFLGTWEVVAIIVVALLLFGGSKLAGIGKASGRAIREFKEETRGLSEIGKEKPAPADGASDDTKTDPNAPAS